MPPLDEVDPTPTDDLPIIVPPAAADANAELNAPVEPAVEEPKAEPAAPVEDEEKARATRRFNDLTRERWEARQEAERERREKEIARAEADALRRKYEPDSKPNADDEIERRANERARQMVAQREFDARCNDIVEQGNKAFGDFEAALKGFRDVGGLPEALVHAAMATDEPAKVLYELGKSPDETRRILMMTPEARGVAVAKIALKAATPPAVTKVPPPIKPIAGQGKVENDPSKMKMEDWDKKFPLPSR